MEKLLASRGVPAQRTQQLLTQLPRRWEKLGDLALIPADAMSDPEWRQLGQEVWQAVAAALKVQRLARQRPVASTGELLLALLPQPCVARPVWPGRPVPCFAT